MLHEVPVAGQGEAKKSTYSTVNHLGHFKILWHITLSNTREFTRSIFYPGVLLKGV